MSSLTPLLKQYYDIKKKYKDSLLLFRVGDFYETFFDDAKVASKVLNITLTSRSHGKENKVPLAGVPVKASDFYISKLVKSGLKVAICEQLEEPQKGKVLVDRGVVEVITPGTVVRPSMLSGKKNTYIMSIFFEKGKYGVAFSDVSTGEFYASELEDVSEIFARVEPREILLPYGQNLTFSDNITITYVDPALFIKEIAEENIKSHFKVSTLDGFGLTDIPLSISAAGSLLHYLRETQKNDLAHIRRIKRFVPGDYMYLDRATVRNLELIRKITGEEEGSLLSVIDRTITPMGGRLIRNYLMFPLTDTELIGERLDIVEGFYKRRDLLKEVRKILGFLSDVERIAGRIAIGKVSPRDLIGLKKSLDNSLKIKEIMSKSEVEALKSIVSNFPEISELIHIIEDNIVEDPPFSIQEGGFIKMGVHKELDELRNISKNGKKWVIDYEKEEREKTNIGSLKVRFNNIFGYYIEVTKPNLKYVPENYIRKQTLVNSERFITEELKEFESKILGAEERIKKLEYGIFLQIREDLKKYIDDLKEISEIIARIDVFSDLAIIAKDYNYTRPAVDITNAIEIKRGRHPVVERLLDEGSFIPNDAYINDKERILLITGPNMAGKSTYLRQVALITILAQMGSFVPAESAHIGVTDRVFTRIGASDDLVRGVSTFLAEMNETANILNNVSSRSLVILDEIGRGTSTYDGLSIAWAVVEYLAKIEEKPKVLFATHYHELTELEIYNKVIVNYTIEVKETENGVVFLRNVKKGKADRSYGIEVAKLAGLPLEVINRANDILLDLEQDDRIVRHHPPKAYQLSLFQEEERLKKMLKDIDPDALSPKQALELLYKLKKIEKEKK